MSRGLVATLHHITHRFFTTYEYPKGFDIWQSTPVQQYIYADKLRDFFSLIT